MPDERWCEGRSENGNIATYPVMPSEPSHDLVSGTQTHEIEPSGNFIEAKARLSPSRDRCAQLCNHVLDIHERFREGHPLPTGLRPQGRVGGPIFPDPPVRELRHGCGDVVVLQRTRTALRARKSAE